MYAIAFDLKIDDLKREYGDPYNDAYDEIRRELTTLGFDCMQGSVYISNSDCRISVGSNAVFVTFAPSRLKIGLTSPKLLRVEIFLS